MADTPIKMANYYLQMFMEEMKKVEAHEKPKKTKKFQSSVNAALAKRAAQRYKKT